jgi:hypothetical protein
MNGFAECGARIHTAFERHPGAEDADRPGDLVREAVEQLIEEASRSGVAVDETTAFQVSRASSGPHTGARRNGGVPR